MAKDRFRKLEKNRYDVIVIGAGMGGLTAAGLLSQRGYDVLVVDQHYVAGGNATIFKRPGYEFDVGIHYLGQCGQGGALPKILHAAGARNVQFNAMDRDGFDTLVFPDFEFRVPATLAAYRQRLLRQFPAERRGIERYTSLLAQIENLQRLTIAPRRALSSLPRSLMALRWATAPLGKFLDTCTRDPKLRAVLTGESGDYAQPASRASLLLHAALMLHYLESGGYYPRGGGQVMSDALAAGIEQAGGKLLLSTNVERILVEGGRATGVVLRNKHVGERTVRADTVISNADIKSTLLELVPEGALKRRTRQRARHWEMSPALGVVYLGVREDVLRGRPDNTNYWVFSDYDQEGEYQAARSGRFRERPMAYVSIASRKDPDNLRLSPPGVVNLQVMSLAPGSPHAWGVSERALGDGSYRDSPAYHCVKAEYAQRLLASAERALPGLSEAVVFQEVATPLTHRRYTRSSGGTSYGLALTPEQFLHRRPGSRTELPGLLLAGASTRMGHGIMGTMMSGLAAAAELEGMSLFRDVLSGAPANTAPRRTPRAAVDDPIEARP